MAAVIVVDALQLKKYTYISRSFAGIWFTDTYGRIQWRILRRICWSGSIWSWALGEAQYHHTHDMDM